jgi:CubicO group peptidase (beta-lactamase class C family)
MKLRVGTPEEAAMSPERIEGVKKMAAGWVENGTHPALVVLVARRGIIVLHEAYGRLTPEPDSPPLRTDSIFPLASGTKPITATCAMLLVQDGLIGLNRPVRDYLPEFKGDGKDAVLVHHLLTHTSGLRSEDVQGFLRKQTGSPGLAVEAMDYPEYVRLVCGAPLSGLPGEEMSYLNLNYTLLGEIVRRSGGRTLEDFARQRLFKPLGMKDTAYVVAESDRSRVVKRQPQALMAEMLNSQHLQGRPDGGAGAFATALDIAVLLQMFLNQGSYGDVRILGRRAIAEMTCNQIPGVSTFFRGEFHKEASWGYGWGIKGNEKWAYYGGDINSPRTFSHGGAGGIFYWVDPVNETVGVYFSVALERVRSGLHRYCADLFINAATAAVDD